MKFFALVSLIVVPLYAQNPNTACWPAAACTDANLFVYSNNFSRSGALRLSGAINSSVTSITVNDATGIIAPAVLTISAEIIHCSTLTTNTFSGCVRGREGTTAGSHADATVVRGYLTAYTLNQYAKEIMALQASLLATAYRSRTIEVELFGAGTAATTGDGKAYFRIPLGLNGMNLVSVKASCYTAGTTGTINIDVDRCVAAATGNICSSTVVDVLSTNITIDSAENDTATAAAAAVINTANDDVATGQFYRFNVDVIHTTPCQGVLVELTFQLP